MKSEQQLKEKRPIENIKMLQVPNYSTWIMIILYTDSNEYVMKDEYQIRTERKTSDLAGRMH